MYPTIFHLPYFNIPIYGYGLMMVFAFLATQWLSTRLAARIGIDPEIFVNVTLLALISGVVGSRMSHVLENLHDYTDPKIGFMGNLWNMVNIRSGGLTFYGGLILASPVVGFYLVHRKVPIRLGMDIVAPCIMLGLAIGRIGCFLNGCCYGADTNLPWGVSFPYYSNAYIDQFEGTTGTKLNHEPPQELIGLGQDGKPHLMPPSSFAKNPELNAIAAREHSNPVHPTQLYSTFNSLLITALLLAYFTMPHYSGRVFALMLMLEGPSRFLLEMLRVEPPVNPRLFGPMSLSMVIGVVLLLIGVVMWFAFGHSHTRESNSLPANAVPA
jgi:phosphatidylglycerol:prolipoprotein diacylglycerol transferase